MLIAEEQVFAPRNVFLLSYQSAAGERKRERERERERERARPN
jgi:hypothetical protein